MDKDKIRKSTKKIRDEADNIEEEVEDKEVSTRGDPIVKLH